MAATITGTFQTRGKSLFAGDPSHPKQSRKSIACTFRTILDELFDGIPKDLNPHDLAGKMTAVILDDGSRHMNTFLLIHLYHLKSIPGFDENEIVLPFSCKQYDQFYDILTRELWIARGNAEEVASYIRITNYLMPVDEELYYLDSARTWSYSVGVLEELQDLVDTDCYLPRNLIFKHLTTENLNHPVYSTDCILVAMAEYWLTIDHKTDARMRRNYFESHKDKLLTLGYGCGDSGPFRLA